MLQAQSLLVEFKKREITHVVGVPDNGSRALYELFWQDTDVAVIQVTREGEAFAVAAGLYLGGQHPLVIIQNTGLLEAGDALRGMPYNMGIPLVMLLGYRGYKTLEPGAERVDSVAAFTEPTLKAWQIPYFMLLGPDDLDVISTAFDKTASTSLPAAILYPGELV